MALRSSHSDGRRGRLRASESVAGWVFADLLLVLFIVGLGTAIPKEVEPPEPPPKPEPEIIVGMETTPTKVTVRVDGDALLVGGSPAAKARREACNRLRDATAELKKKEAEAALVMIFAGHPTDASRAQQVAAAVGQQLTCASRTVFPKGSFGPGKTAGPADVASGRPIDGVVRPFWNGRLAYGEAQLEIYTYTTKKQGSAG